MSINSVIKANQNLIPTNVITECMKIAANIKVKPTILPSPSLVPSELGLIGLAMHYVIGWSASKGTSWNEFVEQTLPGREGFTPTLQGLNGWLDATFELAQFEIKTKVEALSNVDVHEEMRDDLSALAKGFGDIWPGPYMKLTGLQVEYEGSTFPNRLEAPVWFEKMIVLSRTSKQHSPISWEDIIRTMIVGRIFMTNDVRWFLPRSLDYIDFPALNMAKQLKFDVMDFVEKCK